MDVGLDRLTKLPALVARLRSARVGLLCHAASVDRRLVHLIDIMASLGVSPAILFAPEHGFGAAAQDMATIGDEIEPETGARIVSLYGAELADLIPQEADLRGLDVLVVDLQDVGSRYYTFVWTALLAVRAAARVGVHVVLLDRPNPLGRATEGRSQEPGFTSFVGWELIPIRHGLTLAEIVSHFAASDGLPLGPSAAVSVVSVDGWDGTREGALDRPWVLPSPNMPTADTALVYPGGCLLEGTNLSEGRGHTRPFEVFGAPWLDGRALARAFAELGMEGQAVRPLTFIPTFHKHGGVPCGGVEVHPLDARFRPVAVYTALIALAARLAPRDFAFRTERYEFVDDVPAFDLLTGSARTRQAILAGEDVRALVAAVSEVDDAGREVARAALRASVAASW
ncbi:MAG: DUF1343 domain-containing protein [Deltaproteobacteria bacterium]|nr:DUF1343 domain-containing protein [Deltaproteobacteria bacterium]